jgi:hypothetical protein
MGARAPPPRRPQSGTQMNRHDILELAALRGYPRLTITLPTHRTSPDNRQDPIRLKNLVGSAAERLTGEFGKREVAGILQALDGLADTIDHQHNLDGLLLLVGDELARTHRLPFTLPERVVVDETFFTRDLVYALNRSPRYWVLSLAEQSTRLFEAARDDLEELTAGSPFPISFGEHGGRSIVPTDPAINTSQLRDDYLRTFFRAVDQALAPYLADDPLPLAVVGVDRSLAFFREVTSHAGQIVAELPSGHDKTTPHELGRLVWPLVRERLAERRAAIFGELNAAVGALRCASTLGEAWREAQVGRGATLVVEDGYHEAATLDETGLRLLPAGDGAPTLEDAVDELIEVVLAKGGRVVFVDDGSLAQHGRIALILRY